MKRVYDDKQIRRISKYLKPSDDEWLDDIDRIARRYLDRAKKSKPYKHTTILIQSYMTDLENLLRWYDAENYSHDLFVSVVRSARSLTAYQNLRNSAKILVKEAERALIETNILKPRKKGKPKGAVRDISRDTLLLDLIDLYRKYGPQPLVKDGKITRRHFYSFISAAMKPLGTIKGENLFGKEEKPGPIFKITVRRKTIQYLTSQ